MSNIDLKLTKTSAGYYDISFTDGDFTLTDSFETAILMSLLCEVRADASEVPAPEHRRGWWGNEVATVPNYQIGSKLWLLEQARNNQNTLNLAVNYVKNSLQWLEDDGYIKKIEVNGLQSISDITVEIKLIRSQDRVDTLYFNLWDNTLSIS